MRKKSKKPFQYDNVIIDYGAGGEMRNSNMEVYDTFSGIDLNRLELINSGHYPLLKGHDSKTDIGLAVVKKNPGEFGTVASLSANIESDMSLSGLYPSIGFQILERDEHGRITRCVLQQVSVSANPNVDPHITPIA